MNVEIINVGTELLLGEIVNTNATYLQKMIKELGFNIYYQTVVGDNEHRFLECLDIAFKRGCDMVITTGGLGPTADDVTKELSAKYLGLELEFLESEAKKIEDKCFFVMQYADKIPESNYKQAYYPIGAYILENEAGTANGCIMENNGRYIVNLPGPPKEMMYVVEHELKPYLEKFRKEQIYTRDIVTMGVGESDLAVKLKDIIDAQKEVTIALYASEMNVRIRLGVKALTKEKADAKMKDVFEQISEMLERYILKGNLDEELLKVLKPYTFIDETGLQLTSYLPELFGEDLKITVTRSQERLGNVIHFLIEDENHKMKKDLHLLKSAEINQSKLIANMKNYILMFLRK